MLISTTEETSSILRTASKGSRKMQCLCPLLTVYSQYGSSEMFIGEWAEARGIRDQLFIATKVGILLSPNNGSQTLIFFSQYTSNFKSRDPFSQEVLHFGNSAKSLQVSIEKSLKNLRTSYIDLLYLHWWDWDTSVEEVMRALHTVVLQGKVLYLVSSYCYYFYR